MFNSYSCANQYFFFFIFLSALMYGNMIVFTCIEDIAYLCQASPSFDLLWYCEIFPSLNLVGYVLCLFICYLFSSEFCCMEQKPTALQSNIKISLSVTQICFWIHFLVCFSWYHNHYSQVSCDKLIN